MSLSINNVPAEILSNIFNFLTPEENSQNAAICKIWKDVAEETAKNQLIDRQEKKSDGFSSMVGGKKIEDFSPSYAKKLKDIKQNRESLTTDQIHRELNNLTEKTTVCLAGCFSINPESPHIPEDKKEDIAGKAFAEFHEVHEDGTFVLWSEGIQNGNRTMFLPIELFNWTMQANGAVLGNKNEGTMCASFGGKVVELRLTEGSKEAQEANYNGFPKNRDFALKTALHHLVVETATSGHIWPHDLYVPRLDAGE